MHGLYSAVWLLSPDPSKYYPCPIRESDQNRSLLPLPIRVRVRVRVSVSVRVRVRVRVRD